jgi:DNA replication protein DnaC
MMVQDARIAEFCEQLKLIRLASEWPGLAHDAAKTEASFADFFEQLLECEMLGRDERRRATFDATRDDAEHQDARAVRLEPRTHPVLRRRKFWSLRIART